MSYAIELNVFLPRPRPLVRQEPFERTIPEAQEAIIRLAEAARPNAQLLVLPALPAATNVIVPPPPPPLVRQEPFGRLIPAAQKAIIQLADVQMAVQIVCGV